MTGMMWSECKELWLEGPREYILQLWNVLDFGMLSIFIAAFTARFLAFLQATKAQQYMDSYVQESDLSEVTLPPDIQYFTYGKLLATWSSYVSGRALRKEIPIKRTVSSPHPLSEGNML
jgi:hypothetical protein